MKFKIFYLVTLALIFSCSNSDINDLILTNANIININSGEVKLANISIRGNKINNLNSEISKSKRTIDLKGKFVIPGLWDMHVHVHGNQKKLKQFVDNGVLGIRDMGARNTSSVDSLIKWQKIKKYEIPEIQYVGLFYSDTSCFKGHQNIAAYKDLLQSIAYAKKVKTSFYKIHNCFPDNLLPQLDSLATLNNLKIVGHIPEGIELIEYITKFNISSVEHISILLRALSFRKVNPLNMMQATAKLDGLYLDSLIVAMKNNKVAFSPNLLSEKVFLDSYPEDKRPLGEALLRRYMAYTNRIANGNVLMFVATDTGLENIEAGVSLHEELELLSKAGLTNLQVLQSATISPLKYLYEGKYVYPFGVGSEANFLILNENPLEDIRNTKDIYAIINNGTIKIK